MGIKKYIANSDTTITNAYDYSLVRRANYANMGAADSLEYFSIYGQVSSGSIEKSRILVKFPISEISESRNSGTLPNSGSVSFYLKLTNVKHPLSLPSNYDVVIKPVSSSWVEGTGLDMDEYRDLGTSGSVGIGCNWIFRDVDLAWTNQGGDYYDNYSLSYHIENGEEDIFLDITHIVEDQIKNIIPNYGLGIMLSGAYENTVGNISYYTKRFSARNSQYFYSRPCIEARWDSSIKDDRNDFYAESNLLSSDDNKYNLYFYNKVKGGYKNIAGNPALTVKFYTDSNRTQEIIPTYLSVSNPSIGKYNAVVSINTLSSSLYDYWVNASSTGTVYFSSSFDVKQFYSAENDQEIDYVIKLTNLKTSYKTNESTRFKIFSREKNWSPTIYTVANNTIESSIHKNLYYKVSKYNNNFTVVDYSTGSIKYSLVSYDSSGNYFDFDMSLLEPDYTYSIKFALFQDNKLKEFNEIFKFRVEK